MLIQKINCLKRCWANMRWRGKRETELIPIEQKHAMVPELDSIASISYWDVGGAFRLQRASTEGKWGAEWPFRSNLYGQCLNKDVAIAEVYTALVNRPETSWFVCVSSLHKPTLLPKSKSNRGTWIQLSDNYLNIKK